MDQLQVILAQPLIAIIVLLGTLVLFHEAGHFFVGKWFGIGVEIFSIGLGPTLVGFRRKETQYRISVIPLGGFVKFYGSTPQDEVPTEMKGREFYCASPGQRALTLMAGPMANFLLAVLCYFVLALAGIKQLPAQVGMVMEGGAAKKAGLQIGDTITHVNQKPVESWRDLHDAIFNAPNETLNLTLMRAGEVVELPIIPELVKSPDGVHEYGRIGISPSRVPNILTLTDPSGKAALAGFATGDRIEALVVGEERLAVRDWPHLLSLLREHKDQSPALISGQHQLLLDEGVELSSYGLAESQLTIDSIEKDTPIVGLMPKDQLIRWNGVELTDLFHLSSLMSENNQPQAELTLRRQGQLITVVTPLKPVDVQRASGKATIYVLAAEFLGQLEPPEASVKEYSLLGALSYGAVETWQRSLDVGGAVVGLVTGAMPLQALGGPISIAKVASDSVQMGWMTFLAAMALISINLGLLNLVPIPILDGGQLVLTGIEAIRKKPLPQSAIENFQKVGFIMVLALVVMATYNDLSRFWSTMLEGMSGMLSK